MERTNQVMHLHVACRHPTLLSGHGDCRCTDAQHRHPPRPHEGVQGMRCPGPGYAVPVMRESPLTCTHRIHHYDVLFHHHHHSILPCYIPAGCSVAPPAAPRSSKEQAPTKPDQASSTQISARVRKSIQVCDCVCMYVCLRGGCMCVCASCLHRERERMCACVGELW